jgi:hypothetical protein
MLHPGSNSFGTTSLRVARGAHQRQSMAELVPFGVCKRGCLAICGCPRRASRGVSISSRNPCSDLYRSWIEWVDSQPSYSKTPRFLCFHPRILEYNFGLSFFIRCRYKYLIFHLGLVHAGHYGEQFDAE